MEEQEVELLIDRACEKAVKAAMKDLGISNKDVYELHNLLSTYRAIQTSFVATITKGVTLIVLGAMTVAVYMHERI